jgi:hypothetical protein
MIRILTLLVSLFTFGLVDLAEITYEIPVTDMLYFNDTPIEELNGLTLNELFIDSQLLLNPNFDDSSNYTLINASIDNGIGTYSTIVGSAIDQNITATNGHIYYFTTIAKRDNTTGSMLPIFVTSFGNLTSTQTSINLTNDFQRHSIIVTVNTSTTGIWRLARVPGNSLINVDTQALYNLTSLGIDSLTQSQLDRYYELWNNPELNITYEINTLDTQDLIILLASQSVWTIMIHLLYKYAYRPKKKSKRLGM